jgi:hypothetical protein
MQITKREEGLSQTKMVIFQSLDLKNEPGVLTFKNVTAHCFLDCCKRHNTIPTTTIVGILCFKLLEINYWELAGQNKGVPS